MTRTPLKSSNIKSVGYDPKTSTMEVEFHSGDVWQYHGVLPHHHTHLMNAPSAGGYFQREIRDRHRCSRVL